MTFVAAFLTFIGVNQFQLNTAYLQVKQQLAAEPGYVLVNHTRDGRLMTGTVLRDPTARSVSQVVSDLSSDRLQLLLDERTVYFELPEFLTQFEGEKANDSIQTFLNEFDQVEATGEQGILKLTGVISQESLNNILSSADVDRNFKQVDVSETTILPTQKLIQTAQTESETYLNLMNKIANVTFYFLPNSLEFTEESQNSLIELVRHLKRLEAIHTEYDFPPVELLIMGFADSQGTDSTNQRISQERANHVQALLLENGVESIMIVSWGVGHVKGSNLSADSQRRVSISVYSELESTSSQGAL
jgi:outer membrane protein OmpA-like peptidoglycan-associated protein